MTCFVPIGTCLRSPHSAVIYALELKSGASCAQTDVRQHYGMRCQVLLRSAISTRAGSSSVSAAHSCSAQRRCLGFRTRIRSPAPPPPRRSCQARTSHRLAEPWLTRREVSQAARTLLVAAFLAVAAFANAEVRLDPHRL